MSKEFLEKDEKTKPQESSQGPKPRWYWHSDYTLGVKVGGKEEEKEAQEAEAGFRDRRR